MPTLAGRRLAEQEVMKWADEEGGGRRKMATTAASAGAEEMGAARMRADAAIGHRETQRGLGAKGFSAAEQRDLRRRAGAYDD